LFSYRDILKQLRALWESNVSKTGAIGEYLGAKGGEAAVQLTPEGVASAQPSQQLLTGTKRPLEPSSENGRPGKLAGNLAVIPQQDGTLDSENDDEDEEEEELLGSDLDDSEIDELNEDDDLADVDNLDKIDESKVKNVVLGQFERVHRSKNRWKVNLKGCIANINGKDYLFKKLTGEMDFS
jgi:hypothetical protein